MTPPTGADAPPARPRRRRHDPQRRDRIIDACLDVIAEHGVAGTSHRRVAGAAGVPLGSMTYHFAGMDALLLEAFTRFSRSVSLGFEQRMARASTREEAAEAIIAHIEQDLLGTPRDLTLTLELYTLAAREPDYRRLTHAWMSASRVVLETHLDPTTARMIDALVEGLTIHRALDTVPGDPGLTREAVRRVLREAPWDPSTPRAVA